MTDNAKQPYRVLARKYRPKTFSQLIGQETLVRTLENALKLQRLAHAFIFTGVRGVGKTSTARILAKGLNCIGPDGLGASTLEPCDICDPCQAIAEGRHVDVLEIDAASHTGIDDAREIIEGVNYKPVSARYKIYIIDEVHMMSKSAFNALLKTLEEPPDTVKFMFATTEIRKVPVTILSRCQRYDLQRVATAILADHLGKICKLESIEAEKKALVTISEAAEGSVRDGLSLLDQGTTMSHDNLTYDAVVKMLGRPRREESFSILQAAMSGDSATALLNFSNAYTRGAEPEMLIGDLLDLVHQASLLSVDGDTNSINESEKDIVKDIAKVGISHLGRAWQILLKGHGEIGKAPNTNAAAEMLIIRLAHAAKMPTPGELLKKLKSEGKATDDKKNPNTKLEISSKKTTEKNEASLSEKTNPAKFDNTAINTTETAELEQSITSLQEIVKLAEEKEEMLLAARIRNHVRLVSIKQGNLQIALTKDSPAQIPGEIAHYLSNWTQKPWLVTLTETNGEKTLAEQKGINDEKLRAKLAEEPLITEILQTFPGSKIEEIKHQEDNIEIREGNEKDFRFDNIN